MAKMTKEQIAAEKARLEADEAQLAADEAAEAKDETADAIAPTVEEPDVTLIPVSKDGVTIEINHATLQAHNAAGWH